MLSKLPYNQRLIIHANFLLAIYLFKILLKLELTHINTQTI